MEEEKIGPGDESTALNASLVPLQADQVLRNTGKEIERPSLNGVVFSYDGLI